LLCSPGFMCRRLGIRIALAPLGRIAAGTYRVARSDMQQHLSVDGGPSVQLPCRMTSRDDVQQERRGAHFGGRKRCEGHDSEKGRPAGLSDCAVKQRNAADEARTNKPVTHALRCLRMDAATQSAMLIASVRITASKATNQKALINRGKRNSAPPRPINPPSVPMIAPPPKSATPLRVLCPALS
jgi:hypothetical protein